jgi:hypothetical protein
LIKDIKDPEPVELTRMQKKMKRILGAGSAASGMFVKGFMMGGMVGVGFGGLIGTYYAFRYR